MRERAVLIMKVGVALLVTLLLVNGVVYFSVYDLARKRILQSVVDEARLCGSVLEPRVLHDIGCHTAQYVHQTLAAVRSGGYAKSFSLYGAKGNLIFSTDPLSRKEVFALKGISAAIASGDEVESFNQDQSVFEYVRPLKIKEYGTYGALSIEVRDIRASQRALIKTLRAMGIASAVAVIIFAMVLVIIRFILRDIAKRVGAEIYRLEINEGGGLETDYRGLGYFSFVLFKISHYIKDLKDDLRKQQAEISRLTVMTQKQDEFLKLTYKSFIPHSIRNEKVDLEVKYVPFSNGVREFAFIHQYDHLIYMVMGTSSADGIESVLAINTIESVVNECALARRQPREILQEMQRRVKTGEAPLDIFSTVVVLDLKVNRLRHIGNMAIPLIVWKKSDVSFMLLRPQEGGGDFIKCDVSHASENAAALGHGDKIILFNQSVISLENKGGERLGFERFMDILAKNIESSPSNLTDILSLEINKFCEGAGKGDLLYIVGEWKGLIDEISQEERHQANIPEPGVFRSKPW